MSSRAIAKNNKVWYYKSMYGENRSWRYIIGFALVIVLLFFVILLIMHHTSAPKTGEVPATQHALTSYADDDNVTVVEHVVGPINAADTHDEVEVRVTNSTTTLDVVKGYDGNVVGTRTYPMSNASFGEFLAALDKAGFTSGNTDSALKDDSGYCATGQRYIFEVRDGSRTVQRFWATSCGGTKTYKGNLEATTELFRAQIPDYDNLVNNVYFNLNLLAL